MVPGDISVLIVGIKNDAKVICRQLGYATIG